ncbi:MAG: tetratricopeptide repeat protein, partial [Candidatus Aminicenantes bacterium]|nr:tetratricopeptide repeat protein [Candidatus Aminicenantes bacterium]
EWDYDGAIADFDEALKLDPRNAFALRCRGDAKFQVEDFDGAIVDYSQAITVDSQYAIAYFNRGIVLERKREYSRAIKDYQKAAEISPRLKKEAEARIKICESQLKRK